MRLLRVVALLACTAAAFDAAPPVLTLSPRDAALLRIVVVGDTGKGAGAVAQGIERVRKKTPFDAIILTGDNFYPCGVSSPADPRWSINAPLTHLGIPIFPVLGNHDFCGKADPDAQIRATEVLPNWRFPAREYALHSPLADFAFVDTTPLAHGKKNDAAAVIREALSGSRAPWQIVVGHHPVISSGFHGYFPRDEVAKMRTLVPALREVDADLYLCGHDHHLELLRGRMVHLVSGAGSDPIPPVKLRTSTLFPDHIGPERIGFAVVELTAKEMRVRMYGADGVARSEWLRAARR
ncbi:MAG: metallophosphoesterase [Acidobacteriota bacterium]|nr:metallophosphoesterase [Acidobacteriota bacterium]